MKNTIRQYSLPGYELRDYTTEAIAFLRENEPPEGFFVGFSGGKDSIVSLELCRIAGVKHQAFYVIRRVGGLEGLVTRRGRQGLVIRRVGGLEDLEG